MEFRSLRNGTDMAVFPAHFHQAIMRHGFERAGKVAGFASRQMGQAGERFGLGVTDGSEQCAVFIAQYFGQ